MWLEGLVDGEFEETSDAVGWRALSFAKLIHRGVDVPRAFVLPRVHFDAFAARPQGEPLPDAVIDAIQAGWAGLGGPAAVRASPLSALGTGARPRRRGGLPEREMYLHLVDAAEVCEAVRRFWSRMLSSDPRTPAAAMVQRFVVAEASVVLHRPRSGQDVLHIEAAFGGGDLLAAGLVLPDRLVVEVPSARVASRRLGRKQHLSSPRPEGGVHRRTAPPGAARQAAVSDATAARLVALWRQAEEILGRLGSLSVAVAPDHLWVTSVRVLDPP